MAAYLSAGGIFRRSSEEALFGRADAHPAGRGQGLWTQECLSLCTAAVLWIGHAAPALRRCRWHLLSRRISRSFPLQRPAAEPDLGGRSVYVSPVHAG